MSAAGKGALIESLESRTLLSTVVGGTGTPDVVATVPAVFAKSYLAGQRATGLSIPVNLQNKGTGAARGVEDIVLFASVDGTAETAQLTSRPVARAIGIPAGRNVTYKIPIPVLPENLDGSYFIIADVTGKYATSAVSTTTISVTPATVDLSAAITHVPTAARLNGFVAVTLDVANEGNVRAAGRIEISFAESPNTDGSNSASLGSVERAVAIPASKHTVMHFAVKLPIGSASGNQYIVADVDTNNFFNDPNLANNTTVSLTPVSIT